MSEITKQQWAAIAKELQSMMPVVVFTFDGREISIQRERKNESTTLLAVYIDGYIKGQWSLPDREGFDPIVEKVWCKKTSRLYSPQKKKKLEKKFGKRRLREILPNVDAENFYYSPHFGSSRTLVGQYKKLDGLQVVKIGYDNSRMPLEKTEVEDAPATHA